jgi:signal transduction histidine kinase
VYNLVTIVLQGMIELASSHGIGTTVTLRLPKDLSD